MAGPNEKDQFKALQGDLLANLAGKKKTADEAVQASTEGLTSNQTARALLQQKFANAQFHQQREEARKKALAEWEAAERAKAVEEQSKAVAQEVEPVQAVEQISAPVQKPESFDAQIRDEMEARRAAMLGHQDDAWDEDEIAPPPKKMLTKKVVVAAPVKNEVQLPQSNSVSEMRVVPGVSQSNAPPVSLVVEKPDVKRDRAALLDDIRNPKVKLKKVNLESVPSVPEIKPSVATEAAKKEVEPLSTEKIVKELEKNEKFQKAKAESKDWEVEPVVAPTPVLSSKVAEIGVPKKTETSATPDFDRIRQRNIPFQYASKAALEENKLFQQMKRPELKKEELVLKPAAPVFAPKPVSTVDTDRDYALALHLDELQRSSNPRDRALAEDPAYIRSLQEAYDNDNALDVSKLNESAQQEANRQNLEKAPAPTTVVKAPQPRPQPRSQSEDFYVARSLMVAILVDMHAFDSCGGGVFLSYTSIYCETSLSINQNGMMAMAHQSVSYSSLAMFGNPGSCRQEYAALSSSNFSLVRKQMK